MHYHGLALNSFPRTNQSVAWGARNTYRTKVASLRTTEYFARMHDRFWDDSKRSNIDFINPRRQLASDARELEEVTTFIQTYTS